MVQGADNPMLREFIARASGRDGEMRGEEQGRD